MDAPEPRHHAAPATAELATTLRRIEQRLAGLERTLEPLQLIANGDAASSVVDAVDSVAAQLDAGTRLPAVLSVLERLTRPQTLRQLEGLVDLAESAPATLAAMTDTADDLAGGLVAQGVPLHEILRSTAAATRNLVQSGILDESATKAVGQAGAALARSAGSDSERVGPIGLIRALRDPNLQQALGFLISFGRNFGASLPSHDQPPTGAN